MVEKTPSPIATPKPDFEANLERELQEQADKELEEARTKWADVPEYSEGDMRTAWESADTHGSIPGEEGGGGEERPRDRQLTTPGRWIRIYGEGENEKIYVEQWRKRVDGPPIMTPVLLKSGYSIHNHPQSWLGKRRPELQGTWYWDAEKEDFVRALPAGATATTTMPPREHTSAGTTEEDEEAHLQQLERELAKLKSGESTPDITQRPSHSSATRTGESAEGSAGKFDKEYRGIRYREDENRNAVVYLAPKGGEERPPRVVRDGNTHRLKDDDGVWKPFAWNKTEQKWVAVETAAGELKKDEKPGIEKMIRSMLEDFFPEKKRSSNEKKEKSEEGKGSKAEATLEDDLEAMFGTEGEVMQRGLREAFSQYGAALATAAIHGGLRREGIKNEREFDQLKNVITAISQGKRPSPVGKKLVIDLIRRDADVFSLLRNLPETLNTWRHEEDEAFIEEELLILSGGGFIGRLLGPKVNATEVHNVLKYILSRDVRSEKDVMRDLTSRLGRRLANAFAHRVFEYAHGKGSGTREAEMFERAEFFGMTNAEVETEISRLRRR